MATTRSGERSRQRPTGTSGPTPSARRRPGQPAGPGRAARRRSGLASPQTTAVGVRASRAACAATRSWTSDGCGRGSGGAAPARRAAARSAAVSSGSSESGVAGVGRRRPPSRVREMRRAGASTVAAIEEVAVVLQAAARTRPPLLDQDEGEVELGRPPSRSPPARGSGPAAPGPAAAAFWSASITWKSGLRPRSRSRRQLLDQLLERQVLVGVGVEGGSRTRPTSSRKADPPRGRARSARVLMKKPISPSISRRLRLAIGEPTTRSSCAGVAARGGPRRRRGGP